MAAVFGKEAAGVDDICEGSHDLLDEAPVARGTRVPNSEFNDLQPDAPAACAAAGSGAAISREALPGTLELGFDVGVLGSSPMGQRCTSGWASGRYAR